jgi:hypothetical protein
MPEEFLDDPDVSAAIEQVGRKRVPEGVRGDCPGQAGLLGGRSDDGPCALSGQSAPAGIEEQRRGPFPRAGQCGPGPNEVGVEGVPGQPAEGHHPLPSALAAQPDEPHPEVDVIGGQPDRLGDPGSAGVEELQQGAIAEGERRLVEAGRF